jgi:hypothetical protein
MRMTFIIPLFLICAFSNGQTRTYISRFIEGDHIKRDTLVDNVSGYKYIVDRERIYIAAIDKFGKLIWKTDPATDNKLDEYRVKRPTLVYFGFGSAKTKYNYEVIWIRYNNSQFGYLNKFTGEFHFSGQD